MARLAATDDQALSVEPDRNHQHVAFGGPQKLFILN